MNQLKLILLLSCLAAMLVTHGSEGHFRLGRGMKQRGELSLEERWAPPLDNWAKDTRFDERREVLLKRLKNILDKYEPRERRDVKIKN